MSQQPTVECKPDGPYLVRNLDALRNSKDEPVATEPVMALCRCGGSSKKPFCDGTHRTNGFTGKRIADGSADRREDYKGKRITIHDNRSLCAHAGRCTDGLAAVFKYGAEPWIDPDGADVEAIIRTIANCPSGALGYSIEGAGQSVSAQATGVTVTKDGPYAVRGVDLATEAWGEGASREQYTLCRCGASKNKPFCDGSHWDAGFKDG